MNADEGAVLIQAQVHHTTGGWVMHPDPHLDPTGKFFGVHLGDGSGTDSADGMSRQACPSPSGLTPMS